MSQTKQQIQALLAQAAMSPRHRFGQNFMIDRNLVATVAQAGEIAPADLVIEVGPGTGTLTEELLARCQHVLAIEIDRDLAGLLQERHAANPAFELIVGDALESKHQINPALAGRIRSAIAAGQTVRLVANLPYNIASPLVIELLIEGASLLAFTVQKEVGQRLKAPCGSDEYGPLTVIAQLLADVTIERTHPPQAFWPAPTIDSALVVMRRHDQLGALARPFGQFVATLFSSRRKMLRKALTNAGRSATPETLAQLNLTPEQRPETIAPAQLLTLFQATTTI